MIKIKVGDLITKIKSEFYYLNFYDENNNYLTTKTNIEIQKLDDFIYLYRNIKKIYIYSDYCSDILIEIYLKKQGVIK